MADTDIKVSIKLELREVPGYFRPCDACQDSMEAYGKGLFCMITPARFGPDTDLPVRVFCSSCAALLEPEL